MNDPYVKRAQVENYRSRAAYKLLEIDAQEKLIRAGQTVVDLGCAPGAWCQAVMRRQKALGRVGRIVGLDLLPMEPLDGVEFLQGDFREEDVLRAFQALVGDGPVDLVLSDLAPNLSGVAAADAARMADLLELALDFASEHLSPQGLLVAKFFHGAGFSQQVEAFKRVFRQVRERKPQASRAESSETYLVGRGLRASRFAGPAEQE